MLKRTPHFINLRSPRLRKACALAVLPLIAGEIAAQQTAANARNLGSDIEEVIITERSLDTSLPLELARYGNDLEIVTAEQVRSHSFVDVGQALEMLVPGLQLTTQAGAFSYINIQMQGSRSQDVLWTIDGVRINNRLYNSTSPADTLPSSMIERTEVLKGGQGLMYGTSAMAGVINVVTRSFSDTPDGSVTVGAGSNGLRRVNGYGRGALGKHKFVVWGSQDENDGYEVFTQYQPNAVNRKRNYDVSSVGLKYSYEFTDDLRLSVTGIHTEAALGYPNLRNTSINDRNEEIVSARLDYTPSDEMQFFLKSYYHDWDTDYYTPPGASAYWGYEDFGASAGILLAPHRNFEYHLGYDFQTYKGQDDVLLIAGEREDVNALYAQVRSTDELFERARFAAGVRRNETGDVGSTVWNVSGVYDLTETLFIQGSIGTSFLLPSAENLYRIHCPSGEGCTHGNLLLEPEESLSVNASIGGQLDIGMPLSWQVNAWDRRVDNLITTQPIPANHPNPPPPEFTRTFVNVPTEVKVRGAELLLRGPLTPALSFDVSYTYSEEKDPVTKQQLQDRPRRQYKGALAFSPPGSRYGMNVAFRYMGEKFANVGGFGRQSYSDAYLVDAGAHVTLGAEQQHRVSLRLENLLDEEYGTQINSAVLDGSNPAERFLYQRLGPPRTVHVNYSYDF